MPLQALSSAVRAAFCRLLYVRNHQTFAGALAALMFLLTATNTCAHSARHLLDNKNSEIVLQESNASLFSNHLFNYYAPEVFFNIPLSINDTPSLPSPLAPITPNGTSNEEREINGMAKTEKHVSPPLVPSQLILTTDSPRIAIIIDDLGYAFSSAQSLIDLPYPLTLSIIPFTPYGKKIATVAHEAKREVMLHAPMETLGATKWEKCLTTVMSQKETIRTIDEMMDDIPFLSGVNNHGGSKLTQNPDRMYWILEQVAARQLFFIDSRTTANTAAPSAAQKTAIRYNQRDVFLDNERSEFKITQQLNKLAAIAKKKGYAVGIGHPYPETIAALKHYLPSLSHQGIKVVNASELSTTQWQQLSSRTH